VTAETDHGPAEVARHPLGSPGRPQIRDEHYPHRPDAGKRRPQATSAEEAAFLALGDGAAQWLIEAAAAGTRRIRPKMAEAVTLAKLHGADPVDRALGTAAVAGRFGDDDLRALLEHQRHGTAGPSRQRSQDHSLQPGTSAWARFGHAGGDA
jgi:hypothetical protein